MTAIPAYLIDPTARRVTAASWQTLADIRRLLDVERIDAARFDAEHGPAGDVIYIDDDGLSRPDRAWFWIAGYYAPLAGRGLVVGTGRGGGSRAPRHTLAEIEARVEFGEPMRLIPRGANQARLLWVPARRDGLIRSLDHL